MTEKLVEQKIKHTLFSLSSFINRINNAETANIFELDVSRRKG